MNNLFSPIAMGGGHFDIGLVLLSYVVAVLASFTAISLSKRYTELEGEMALYWLLGGSFSMGLGIWSMHFVGMLAFSMEMPFSYDIPITLLSMLVGMAAAGCAIYCAAQKRLGWANLLGGGLLLGSGIAGMHYTGMAGMVMAATLSYDPLIFTCSIIIAIAVSMIALWMMSKINQQASGVFMLKLLAALIMGFAICGMHYTGMAAAIYTPSGTAHLHAAGVLSNMELGLCVAAATVVVLLITLLTLYFERKLDVEKEVATRLALVVKERTQDLEIQAKNLQESKNNLEREMRERQYAQEESVRLSYILDESSTEIYYFEESSLKFVGANQGAQHNIQYSATELKAMTLLGVMVNFTREQFESSIEPLSSGELGALVFETVFQRKDQSSYLAKVNIHRSRATIPAVYVAIVEDITERKKLEEQLSRSSKLESIGQLAAGIAHEINTPIQFIGDNLLFVKDSFDEVVEVVKPYAELLDIAGQIQPNNLRLIELQAELAKVDLEYLLDEVPNALLESSEGINRVADIVRAMKEFSHPGEAQVKSLVQLNQAIETTLTVCRNEWKYVADIDLQLADDLPEVKCVPGEINQVLLNLIVNAAHAIGDVINEEAGQKGLITISTFNLNDCVEVQISDSGQGIPEAIKEKVFEPFYTTKGVGKGTGQGLSIAHSIIVNNHQGQISFESVPDEGTTFSIRLPLTKSDEVAA